MDAAIKITCVAVGAMAVNAVVVGAFAIQPDAARACAPHASGSGACGEHADVGSSHNMQPRSRWIARSDADKAEPSYRECRSKDMGLPCGNGRAGVVDELSITILKLKDT